MQYQMGNVSRDKNSKQESKGNARNQNHAITEMNNAFGGLIIRLDTVYEKKQ